MPNSDDFKEELIVEMQDLGVHHVGDESDEYETFVTELIENAAQIADDEGHSIATVISRTIMAMFQPGFVIVASPNSDTDEEGRVIPEDVAIAVLANSNYTSESLIYVLGKLVEGMQDESDAAMEQLLETDEK